MSFAHPTLNHGTQFPELLIGHNYIHPTSPHGNGSNWFQPAAAISADIAATKKTTATVAIAFSSDITILLLVGGDQRAKEPPSDARGPSRDRVAPV
jgi:hypothetical protein